MHKRTINFSGMLDELAAAAAPRDVQSAAEAVVSAVQRGRRPAADLVLFVTQWVAKRGAQNRFGK